MQEHANHEAIFTGSDPSLRFVSDVPLHILIDRRARSCPDKIAYTFDGKTVTYREVRERSNRLARWLQSLGVQPGDRVGVVLDRSIDLAIALLAVWKAGAANVPIDPEFPIERIRFMLEDSAAALLLTSRRYEGYFRSPGNEAMLEDLPGLATADLEQPVSLDSVAHILYTSGSTGQPKGVLLEHHSLTNLFHSLMILPGLAVSDKFLAIATVAFDIATVELFFPLFAGAETVIAKREVARDGRAMLDMIRTNRVTVVQGTPANWKMMINAGWNEPLPIRVISCGETLSRQLADQLLARSLEVYNFYGPTETTVYCTGGRVMAGTERITIGRPFLNQKIYILDAAQRPVQAGEMGEIYAAGEGVARGYLNRDALTAERFLADPFSPGKCMYRSGDLGRWTPDGDIEFLGREDHQVKIRGYRIELGEVEYHLLRLDGVKEAVVLNREDQLVAYVVTEEKTLSKARVIAWRQALKRSLPPYMIPASYIPLSEMPLSLTGKIDRKALLSTARVNAVDGQRKPPRTTLEKEVTEVWKAVLEIDEIDIDDDFFELGGDSIVAVDMMGMMEERIGKRLPMASLFNAPTIEKICELLASEDEVNWGSLVPIKPTGTKPPLYIVHGIGLAVMAFHGLAKHMDPEQPVFGIQARGLNGAEKPLHTIEDIAASYLEDIQTHNPHGPYCLAGYSLGGLVAYEMARQLRSMGKEIKLLAVLDTYAGDLLPSEGTFPRLMYQIKRQPAKFLFHLGSFLRQPRAALEYQWHNAAERMGTERTGQKAPDRATAELAAAMKKAEASYRPMINEEDVLEVFRVKKRLYFIYDPVFLGWKPFLKKGIHINEVAGDHRSFLDPPNNREVALRLQYLLDREP